MKKFSKVVLIFACGLFFGGLLLTLISLALGADGYILRQRLEQTGVIQLGGSYWKLEAPYYNYGSWRDLTPDLPYSQETTDFLDLTEKAAAGEYEIKNLDFDFSLGDIYIKLGEDFDIIYGNNNTRLLYSEKKSGDKWTISSNRVGWRWAIPWRYRRNDIRLTVVLPYDFVAEKMDIRLGAGNLQAEYLSAKEMVLDVGLGNCQAEIINAGYANFNVGVGNLGSRHFTVDDAYLEVGLGNMELTLTRPLDKYLCHIEVGLGSVDLGGNRYSGVADVKSGGGDAPYRLNINCGLGSVNVSPPQVIEVRK